MERALRGKRTMHKQIPSARFSMGVGIPQTWEPIYSDGRASGGWVSVPAATSAPFTTASLYYETYFDLSGYTLDDLTIYPEVAGVQDPGVYSLTGSVNGRLGVIDIVSQERLDITKILEDYTDENALPGSSSSLEDWTQIIMGRFRLMTLTSVQSAPEILTAATDSDFSSMEPSAVEKLWVYRILISSGLIDDAAQLTTPACTYIIRFESIEEDELHYMMRLKRSYELGTQGD